MKLTDLNFDFPAELLAQSPERPSRVMWVEDQNPQEIKLSELIEKIPAGDVLVLNDTRVLKRRVFADDLEILFLHPRSPLEWEVLFPSKKFKIGDIINLPDGVQATLKEKGRPQTLQVSRALDETYFQSTAELPLPPYIQKAREQRHAITQDETWYQTAWAEKPGSLAAPTASLHFSQDDLAQLKRRGVEIQKVTLHVGLGTFLPVIVDDLNQHEMHEEYLEVSAETWKSLQRARSEGRRVWCLGTTAVRAVESVAQNLITASDTGFFGSTKLLIQPGYEFQVVDRLLTNFHQPQSTLLALVGAFAGLDQVKACYSWAIERRFRLFSYGDLSVWIR